MTTYDSEWTLDVLARIRVYHGAQDTGQAAEIAWTEALAAAGISSGTDAVAAVVRHYSQPNCNRWITPGDVIAGVRAIRDDRLERTKVPTPNVRPDDVAAHLAEIRAIRAAIADGRFDADAYAASGRALSGAPALRAIGDGRVPARLHGRVSLSPARLAAATRRPEPPLPVHYGKQPLTRPAKVITAAEVDRLEAARTAQLAALATAHPGVTGQPTAVPPGPGDDPLTSALVARRRRERDEVLRATQDLDELTGGRADAAS